MSHATVARDRGFSAADPSSERKPTVSRAPPQRDVIEEKIVLPAFGFSASKRTFASATAT